MNDATEQRGGLGAGPPQTAVAATTAHATITSATTAPATAAMKTAATPPRRTVAPVRPPAPAGLFGGGGGAQHPAYGQKPAAVRRIETPAGFWLPDWARSLVDSKASPDAMVRAALDRVAKDHSETTLVEAQTLINEVTRSADHAAVVKGILTHDTVKSFLAAPQS